MFIVIDMYSERERGGVFATYDDADTAAAEYNAEGELDRQWVVAEQERAS